MILVSRSMSGLPRCTWQSIYELLQRARFDSDNEQVFQSNSILLVSIHLSKKETSFKEVSNNQIMWDNFLTFP